MADAMASGKGSSPLLVQKISTGDVIVFDKASRDLIVIGEDHAAAWGKERSKTMATAREYAKRGKAQHFDRVALERIQSALAGIVLLV